MDTRITVRYSLILVVSIFFFIPRVSRVVILLQFFAAFTLFYFLPGVFLVRKFLDQCYLISSVVLAVLAGMCFHIVYVYVLSLVGISFNTCILLIPGIIAAVLADYYTVQLPNLNPKEIYLVLAGITFFLLTITVSPGEDANGHLLLVNMISEENVLPSTYTLYPEIHVSYHMGFHIIVSELEYITKQGLLRVTGSLFGVFMMFSSYACVKSFHTEKAGLISGILVGFGVLPPLYYLSYGAYASIVVFAVQPFLLFLVYNTRSLSDIPVLSLVSAAGIMSHVAFFLFWIPLLVLKKYRTLVPTFAASLGLSIPHLLRVQPVYSPQEITQLTYLWYMPEVFTVQMVAERIGVVIFICGILGLIFLKKKELLLFSVWLLSLLLLAVTSLFDVEFPFWFVFFANRMVDFMVLPLVFLASVFVSEIGKKKYYILAFLLILPLVPHYYRVPRSCEGPLFPTDSPEFAADQEGIAWLLQNTDESAVVLNDWWTGTGSSWITSLGKRRLIFPYLYVHDHFLDILDIPERSRDILWITAAPDTQESHALLKEWGVDYIFLSSYVEDRVKWRRDSWDVQQLEESPHYDLVFRKDQTYIFKVKKEWDYIPLFVIKEVEIEKGTLNISLRESFPIKKLIRIFYQDSSTGIVQFWSDKGLTAEIPLLNTGDTTLVLPFDKFLHIESDEPLTIVHADIVTAFPAYNLGNTGFSPDWLFNQYIILEEEGYIYVFGVRTLTIHYKDTAPGNVDINVLVNNTWVPLTVIEREGDGLYKQEVLTLPEYHFLVLRIKVYNSPFYVVSLEYSNLI